MLTEYRTKITSKEIESFQKTIIAKIGKLSNDERINPSFERDYFVLSFS